MAKDQLPFWRTSGFFPGIVAGVVLSAALGVTWYAGAHWQARPQSPPPAPYTLPPTNPGPKPPPLPDPPPPAATDARCQAAFESKGDLSDAELFSCGLAGQLGACHIWQGCPTCVCSHYAGSENLCHDGKCGYPLDGTGCVSEAFYGAHTPYFNCHGSETQVGACMMRKLLQGGYCERK